MAIEIEKHDQTLRAIDPYIDMFHGTRVSRYVALAGQRSAYQQYLEAIERNEQPKKKAEELSLKEEAELWIHSAYLIEHNRREALRELGRTSSMSVVEVEKFIPRVESPYQQLQLIEL